MRLWLFLTLFKRGINMLDFYYEQADDVIEYHHKKSIGAEHDYHLHERYEIYFLVEGHLNYFVNQSTYSMKSGELLIVNNTEIHTHSLQKNKYYERILILFEPSLPRLLNYQDFDLLKCFTNRLPGENNKIRLTTVQLEELMRLFYKLETVSIKQDIKSNVLKLTVFVELLVFINEIFENNHSTTSIPTIPGKLSPILEYIDQNLCEDLSLETLEKMFFINRFYLSRIFKNNTGISIHQYIMLKRIIRARMLLKEGNNVTKACYASGFNDYSNFIRIFKKLVGVLPSEYQKHPF